MSEHAVVHFEIAGPDSQKLQDFYGPLFGWKINADNEVKYAVVHRPPSGIGGGLPQSQDGSSYVTVYITCGDDVQGGLDKAKAAGATEVMPVMAVPGGPTIAMFSDPAGNIIGLVNGNPGETPPVDGTGDGVTWFEIQGGDGAKLQQWYRDLFGWTINADNPQQYGEVAQIGAGIGGGIFGNEESAVRVYVEVDDLAVALKKAGELGGTTVMEPSDVPGGPTIAMFTDPAGNATGLLLKGSFGQG